MKQFYVKRSGKVFGPFGGGQISEKLRAGQLRDSDEISKSKSGPWRSIAVISDSRREHSLPTVTEFTVARSLLGQWSVSYRCPECASELKSSESELSSDDQCPECGVAFSFSRDILSEIEDNKDALAQARELKKQEKELAKKLKQEAKQRKIERELEERRLLEEAEKQAAIASSSRDSPPPNPASDTSGVEFAEADAEQFDVAPENNSTPLATQAHTAKHTNHCWYCGLVVSHTIQCPYCRMLQRS